jgi:hypothetical protein
MAVRGRVPEYPSCVRGSRVGTLRLDLVLGLVRAHMFVAMLIFEEELMGGVGRRCRN